MAVTNLHLAKMASTGEEVRADKLSLGMQVTFPSGLGGTLPCECVHLDERLAVFESTNNDFPATFCCNLDAADFDKAEFAQLFDAMMVGFPNNKQRELIRRAAELGYVTYISYTQYSWTYHGISMKVAVDLGKADSKAA